MRVPVYERQATLAPLQGGQVSPIMPAGDYGTGATGVAKNLVAKIQQINNDREDARTLELFNKFKADSQEYHEHPDKGIYNTRLGFQSQGVYTDADQWLRERGEHYAADLKGERAKANFRNMARQYIEQRGLQNSRFEADQTRKYQAEQADANIKNWLNEIESKWDDNDTITTARNGIQQALELKMRGSSREAFNAAWDEIENQIGVSRIRQAYVKDPLLAVRMLDNPDIKLNPKVRAELIKTLGARTEVYELQAIAQTYSQYYTPENSVEAYNSLLQRYGADKGQKAFNTLSHIWSIENSQESAREQNLRRLQRENELTLYMAFQDPNVQNPTEEQIRSYLKSQSISPNGAISFLNEIQAIKANEEKAKQAQEKLAKEQREIKLLIDAWEHKYPTDKTLDYGVNNGWWSLNTAQKVRNERIQHESDLEKQKVNAEKNAQAQEKKRLNDNANDFQKRINRGEYPTNEELISAQENNDLTPDDVSRFIKIVEAHNVNDEQAEQRANAEAMDIIISNGGSFNREEISEALKGQKITLETARRHWNIIEQNEAKEAKAKADREKLQDLTLLDEQAQKIVTASMTESDMLNYIHDLKLSPDVEDKLRERARIHWERKQQKERDRQAQHQEQHDNLYHDVKLDTMRGEVSDEDMDRMFADRIINNSEYNELKRINADRRGAQEKAEQEVWQDNMRDKAFELAKRFPLGQEQGAYDEMNAMNEKDRVEVRKTYNRLVGEQQTEKNNENRARDERQKQNYKNLEQKYWRNGQFAPNEEIFNLERASELSDEQVQRAYSMNDALRTRAGITEQLMKDINIDFQSLSRGEQERLIMERMGTSEEQRKENVARLFQRLLDDTLTDSEINWEYTHGKIAPDDRDNLHNYYKKFESVQKARIQQSIGDLMNKIRNATGKGSTVFENNARLDFLQYTSTIDLLHTKNFEEVIDSVHNRIFEDTIRQIEKTRPQTKFFGLMKTQHGARIDEARSQPPYRTPEYSPQLNFETFDGEQEFIAPNGTTTEFTNIAPVIEPPTPPEPSPDIPIRVPLMPPTMNYLPQNIIKGFNTTQKRIAPYEDIINQSADQNGVEPELVKAIITAESAGKANAVSDVGAQGLMQLMPRTAKMLGVDNSFDVVQNIRGGTKYIAQLLRRYAGNIEKALWAYNAGPGNADKGRMPKPSETRPYIKRVMEIYNTLKRLNGKTTQQNYNIGDIDLGNNFSSPYLPQDIARVEVAQPIRSSDADVNAALMQILFGMDSSLDTTNWGLNR